MHSNDLSPGTLAIGGGPGATTIDPEQAARDADAFREVLYFAVSIPLVVPAIVVVGAILRFLGLR